MANISSKELADYISGGMNVLISGPHGVGKSAITYEAANRLGLKCAMFTGSTMDPYIDLVGIPKTVPYGDAGEETLKLVRPHKIDDAEVIFVDEYNRIPDVRGQNAFMEMALERSINGEPLPNLKSVVVCINPANDETSGHQYQVNDIDPAMIDRFDIYEELKPEVSVSLLVSLGFTRHVATALVKWHRTNSGEGTQYISPRRLVKIGKNYMKFPTLNTLNRTVPPGGKFATGELHKELTPLVNPEEAERQKKAQEAKAAKKAQNLVVDATAFANSAMSKNPAALRRQRDEAASYLKADTVPDASKATIAHAFARACNGNVGPENLVSKFGDIINHMSDNDLRTMISGWPQQKRYYTRQALKNKRLKNNITEDRIRAFVNILQK